MKETEKLGIIAGLLLTSLLVSVAGGCISGSGGSGSQSLTVFAASSLTDAFSEIGEAFEAANPGVRVMINFASSHALRTQIEEGAPADVFASANQKEMNALIASGLISAREVEDFVVNKLVVIVPDDNPANLTGLPDLAKPGIKIVLAAENVPVGDYARQSLALADATLGVDFMSRVMQNVVSNEDNVRQAAAKVQLGEADAGIVYLSDALAVPGLVAFDIPQEWNVTARYPIAPLTNAGDPALARAFIVYVRSAEGAAILRKWGFTPAE